LYLSPFSVLSGRKGTPSQEAFPVLKLAARDWINEYAPGRRWMAALQDHNGAPHLHLIVQNVGDDGVALKIKPHQVKAMAGMEFTEHAVSAKGIGRKGVSFYSKAEGLNVQQLARELAHVYDPAEGLAALVERHPDLSKFRRRANGQLISFAYGGERIRLRTLQFYVDEILTPPAPAVASPAPIPPALPVPPPSSPAAPPLPQPESPLDQFVRAAQPARPAQKPTPPGVNMPGINL
jgi:hypothetical protein